ncbi:MAG: LytR C-terminal domain-containing protein [Actinomycetota bacterium]
MATSTIRFAIIVALVAVGAVLIAQFPQASTGSASAGSPPATPNSSPSPNGGGQNGTGNGGGTQQPTEPLQGVKVAVYNGTTQTGLAADVAAALVKKFGVKVNSQTSILNAPSIPVAVTTIYYVSAADKTAASDLADSYFKKLSAPPTVQKLPDNTTVPAGVQVAVYLGTDYVNTA